MEEFRRYAEQYRAALYQDVLPFWLRHSIDHEYGGYFTCLERDGRVYDMDKFIWLQGREVWTFSMLYNHVEHRQEWLQAARSGVEFLRRFGQAENGDWYFALTREGQPLVQPYNVFSDCFAAMAFGQYSLASGDDASAGLARSTYQRILRRQDNPKGPYNKMFPDTRPLRNFALPMILCNLTLELEHILSAEETESTINACIHAVMGDFIDQRSGLVLENISPDGRPVDSFEGRLLNPGHAIEAMWFIMELARRRDDRELTRRAVEVVLREVSFGWDEEFGGIFYFLDRLGKPPLQLEWNQKLWWVHVETLIALSLGYELTGELKCLEWYRRVHDYTWTHFPDPDYGEWFGYLDRQGRPLLTLKGGKWKGCFHVPRGLLRCSEIFSRLVQRGFRDEPK